MFETKIKINVKACSSFIIMEALRFLKNVMQS